MELLKTEKTFTMIKDTALGIPLRHIPTQVYISWDYEQSYPVPGDDFDFGDEKENEKYAMRFHSGELLNVCLFVRAKALGEEGLDSLGACHVTAKNFEQDIIHLVSEHDMKNNACLNLQGNILCQFRTLKTALIDGIESTKASESA